MRSERIKVGPRKFMRVRVCLSDQGEIAKQTRERNEEAGATRRTFGSLRPRNRKSSLIDDPLESELVGTDSLLGSELETQESGGGKGVRVAGKKKGAETAERTSRRELTSFMLATKASPLNLGRYFRSRGRRRGKERQRQAVSDASNSINETSRATHSHRQGCRSQSSSRIQSFLDREESRLRGRYRA